MSAINCGMFEKDSYTSGHCKRVAYYCSLLGNKAGLQMEKMESLIIGAFFHDFGKIAIPIGILNKPEALSGRERKIVRFHPKAGAELLLAAGCQKDAASAMLYYHERYDETGYPYGQSTCSTLS